MLGEFAELVSQWSRLDTWIVITGMLAAMTCSLPGCFLFLRRQSMMGDALSHTSLLGIAIAFLTAFGMQRLGWLDEGGYETWRNVLMFCGAIAIGVLAAVLTEAIHQLGRVEASAALGVVFTVFFAIGLLLVKIAGRTVDLDENCVLYGSVERSFSLTGVPQPVITNGISLFINLTLAIFFYKELRISTFDPGLANSQGIRSRWMHYGLMAVTAGTVVAAFESVGVILVIAMLITPAATAHLLTDRLWKLILIALACAAISAVGGHVLAITLPAIVFSRLGIDQVQDASTAGMMSVVSVILFAIAVVSSPRYGVLSKLGRRLRLGLRIVAEDLLGLLYRLEEREMGGDARFARQLLHDSMGVDRLSIWLAMRTLHWKGSIDLASNGVRLTERGRSIAKRLVRSHRLWESYLQKHSALPDERLHDSAMRVEHFIPLEVRDALDRELQQPSIDPHGQEIPPEQQADDNSTESDSAEKSP